MKLTEEEYQSLSGYEQHFRTAVRSKWSRYPGSSALHLMHRIYCRITGSNQRLNASCSSCILRLLTDLGNIYFKEKEEREALRKVEVQEKEMPTEAKVEVKTEKKKKRTSKKK